MLNRKKISEILAISFGILLVDIGFYFFLTPTALVTGGAMGLAIIIKDYIPFQMAIFIYIFNFIALIAGLIFLGKGFFYKTIYASVLSPSIILIFELFFDSNYFISRVTEGKYIIAVVCSSILVSYGIGIAIRNNSSSGGMDVFQIIISKFLKVPLSKTMYFTDLVIVAIGGFTFVNGINYNIEIAVYGAICVLVVGYFVDFIAVRGRFMRTAYIITDKPNEIKNLLYSNIGRGVTFSNVVGGYTGLDKTMVICTMDKTETYQLKTLISKVDDKAFTFITSTKEVIGEYDK